MRISLCSRRNTARAFPQTPWASRSEASNLSSGAPLSSMGMLGWCASVPREGLTKSERQLLQFLALARLTGPSIPMWQWILLRFCGRLVCQSAGGLILHKPCLLPRGLTATFKILPALQLQYLGLWAPFPTDCLASVITRCRYTMLLIALLSMCRYDLWVRGLLLFWPLSSLGWGIWC